MRSMNLKKITTMDQFTVNTFDGDATFDIKRIEDQFQIIIELQYSGAFGMGEKFDAINQKGKTCINVVKEKFCNQGEVTYCSVPFFMTDTGLGVFVNSKRRSSFQFNEKIIVQAPSDAELVIFTGECKEIVKELNHVLGGAIPTPPKYAFGPWISANHWHSQNDVEKVRAQLKKYQFPATVIVLEAWSDEATFYIFNGAKYTPKSNGEAFRYEDFDFTDSPYWRNPKKMITELEEDGLNLVLWQIPVYKKLGEGEYNRQHELDIENAVENHFCVQQSNGEAYQIPEGNWFAGSMIPDFTNEKTKENWFQKRKYLLDIGVKGFKTDGGEFIYREDLEFANGDSGLEQKNAYAQTYIDAYREFIGNDRILFSRAGTTGIQRTPFLWAGDHQSTNDELVNAYRSAISAACSGIRYWGYDIGGFAGPLPSKDLYIRSTQFACFCPIMQWHSEPDGGQFSDIMPGFVGNNERSPWNLAAYYKDDSFLDEIRYWYQLRMELLPYIYEQAEITAKSGVPMMRPIFWEDRSDKELLRYENEYFFGEDMLVAPLFVENELAREVYLPKGNWIGLFSKQKYKGKNKIQSYAEKYPVFVREGKEVQINL